MTDAATKPSTMASAEQKAISYNEVASKLINDRFLLTALELHTELIESGRELKQLKEFFSDPGNFEQHLQADISAPIRKYTYLCK